MIFACDRCGRRYSVPDERIQGRPFRVTCKACGQVIHVRPQEAQKAKEAPAPKASDGVPQAAEERTGEKALGLKASLAAPEAKVPLHAEEASKAPSAGPLPEESASLAAKGLTSDEMAGLSGGEGGEAAAGASAGRPSAAGAPSSPPGGEGFSAGVPGQEPREEGDSKAEEGKARLAPQAVLRGRAFLGEGPSRGPRFLRVLLFLALLAAAVAAFLFLYWPGIERRFIERPAAQGAGGAPAPLGEVPAPADAVGKGGASATPPKEPSLPMEVAPLPASDSPRMAAAGPNGQAASRPRQRPADLSAFATKAFLAPDPLQPVRRAREAPPLAAADRQVIDLLSGKKDAEGGPKAAGSLDLDGARSLDPSAVERVMEESQGAFSACVSRSMKAGEPGGVVRKATLRLKVDGGGGVAAAGIAEPKVGESQLGKCLLAAARRLSFPAFQGGSVEVAVPLVLEAR